MQRQIVRLSIGLLWALFGGVGALVAQDEQPRNVIFILSDDHRYDFMGFMGRPGFLETPGMDGMAAKGMHLQNAFVSTALCSPSRASILTGMYAHRHGVVDNQRLVPEGTQFFPELLQQAGYETAFIGKWHMGHAVDDPRPGFDHWISYRGQGTYYDPELNMNGERTKHEGYTADIVTDYALEWLAQDRTKPFFLYLSHKSVHAMFEPAQRHLNQYEDAELAYAATMPKTNENYRDKPAWVLAQRDSWHGVDYMYHGQMDFDMFYRRYCEAVLGLDESIQRVTAFLEAQGLDESTLVMYMGDNGFSFGEHGLIDKRHMYEESMRVPMIAQAPGLIEPGTKLPEMIQNIDIAPTILDLAGVEIPATMDGRSFLPLLRGEDVPWREEVLYAYYWEWNFPQTPTTLGLRTDRYKYIFYHGVWDTDELYDLQEDPLEKHNLANQPDYEERKAAMKARLFEILEETGGMVVPLRFPQGFQGGDHGPPAPMVYTDEERAAVEQELKDLERAWLAAYTHNDVEAMERIVAEGFTITYEGGAVLDKAQTVAMLRPGAPSNPNVRQYTEETTVRLFGNTAVLTGVYVNENPERTRRARYTDTYMKRNGQWQVVASQLTALPEDE